jgi:hypothetical protein
MFIIVGWMIVTVSYFITLFAMYSLYPLFFQQPLDHNWSLSGAFVGIPLIIVPFIIGGLFIRMNFAKKRTKALWASLVPVIGERLLIYFIGYLLVLGGGDGSMNGITTMMFIRGEAAPYFTPTYIFSGVASVAICVVTATYTRKNGSEIR